MATNGKPRGKKTKPSRLDQLTPAQRDAAVKRAMHQVLARQRMLRNQPPLDINLHPYQVTPEGDWRIRFFMGGRGSGKTYTGAAWAAQQAEVFKRGSVGVLVAPTFQSVRQVMVDGKDSGIIDMLGGYESEGGRIAKYNKSDYEITTSSGSTILMRSADRPETLRGLDLDWAWCDEPGSWRYSASWFEGLKPALRRGPNPQAMFTGTPRRVRLVRHLWKKIQDGDDDIVHTFATTFDNVSLNEQVKADLAADYEGTELGRQELYGEMIEEVSGALWRTAWIKYRPWQAVAALGGMAEVVIGVDPTSAEDDVPDENGEPTNTGAGDECGIIVAGRGADNNGYVIDDATLKGSPGEWCAQILKYYRMKHTPAKWVVSLAVIEKDGSIGQLGREIMSRLDGSVPVRLVKTKGQSKGDRARPVSLMYEQGRIYHLEEFPILEDQMTGWIPGDHRGWSPDRIDALVWAMRHLFPRTAGVGKKIAVRDRRLEGRR